MEPCRRCRVCGINQARRGNCCKRCAAVLLGMAQTTEETEIRIEGGYEYHTKGGYTFVKKHTPEKENRW